MQVDNGNYLGMVSMRDVVSACNVVIIVIPKFLLFPQDKNLQVL